MLNTTKTSGRVNVKIDKKKYSRLLASTLPAIIETEEENDRMLAIVESLMDKGDGLSPEEEKLFKLLVHLIQDFERRFYKPESATPLEVLNELVLANNLRQTDLVPIFGSKSVVSEVIHGKRGISKAHAKALADFFHTSTDVFL
ncbi:MAG: transcriptional regulator [Blastocatellia bacterium]|nr:transcriptional regulator [Blastocatellia bacterium]